MPGRGAGDEGRGTQDETRAHRGRINVPRPRPIDRAGELQHLGLRPLWRIQPAIAQLVEFLGRGGNRFGGPLWCGRPACTVLCVPCVPCGRFLSGRPDGIPAGCRRDACTTIAGCRRDARTTTTRLPHALRQRKRLKTRGGRIPWACFKSRSESKSPHLMDARVKDTEEAVIGTSEHDELMVGQYGRLEPHKDAVLRHGCCHCHASRAPQMRSAWQAVARRESTIVRDKHCRLFFSLSGRTVCDT